MSELTVKRYYHPDLDDGSTRGMEHVAIEGLPGTWVDGAPQARANSANQARYELGKLTAQYGVAIPDDEIAALVSRINDCGRITDVGEAHEQASVEYPYRSEFAKHVNNTYAAHDEFLRYMAAEAGEAIARTIPADWPPFTADRNGDLNEMTYDPVFQAMANLDEHKWSEVINLGGTYQAEADTASYVLMAMRLAVNDPSTVVPEHLPH